jgi:ATP synthase protein I
MDVRANNLKYKITARAYRVVQLQLLITLLIAIAAMGVGIVPAYSALLGGMVVVLANGCFTKQVFRYFGAQAIQQIARSFYLAETLKIAITVALLALLFNAGSHISLLALLIGFSGAQLSVWLAPVLVNWTFN